MTRVDPEILIDMLLMDAAYGDRVAYHGRIDGCLMVAD